MWHATLRDQLLRLAAHVAVNRPLAVLLVAGLLTSAAAVACVRPGLRFASDRNELLADDLAWNRWYQDYQRHFAAHDDVFVVLDPGPEGPDEATREAARRLASRLRGLPEVERVLLGFHRDEASPKAMRLLPAEAFAAQLKQLEGAAPLLRSPTLLALVSDASRGGASEGEGIDAAEVRRLAALVEASRAILAGEQDASVAAALLARAAGQGGPVDMSDPDARAADPSFNFLTSANGRLLLLQVRPRAEATGVNQHGGAVAAIRRVVDAVEAATPGVAIGLTGVPVLEADETALATRDGTRASWIAAVLVGALLLLAFRGVTPALLLMAGLGMGLVWTLGLTAMTIGRLQLLSVMFGVILLGLGSAPGVHLFVLWRTGAACRGARGGSGTGGRAVRRAVRHVGPAAITAALTTAAAFVAMAWTDFQGMAEMGLIAAAGLLLCAVIMMVVLPAAVVLLERARPGLVVRPGRGGAAGERWLAATHERLDRRQRGVLVTIALATMVAGAAAAAGRIDLNLLRQSSPDLEALVWQERIADAGEQPVWWAASVAPDEATARRWVERYRKTPGVAAVMGYGLLVPERDAAWRGRMADLASVRARLAPWLAGALEAVPPPPPDATTTGFGWRGQWAAVRLGLSFLRRNADDEAREAMTVAGEAVGGLLSTWDSLAADRRAERLDVLRRGYTRWRVATAGRVAEALEPGPLEPADLPARLIDGYTLDDGRVILEIWPERRGSDALEPAYLASFVGRLERVDARVTGPLPQILRSGELVVSSYQRAAMAAGLAVLLLIGLDLRSPAGAALACLPIALGLVWLGGTLAATGLALNLASLMILPMLFGIGVDHGVHMVHRWRRNPRGRPRGLSDGVARGVTVTSWASILGFGALLFAEHRGLAGIGAAMSIGLTWCWAFCLIAAPLAMGVTERWWPVRGNGAD